jgi:ATP-dependent RNA helicase DDX23/PRP28
VILDEADKMIEMDLEESVNKIISSIPSSLAKSEDEKAARQQEELMRVDQSSACTTFMMFSATMLPEVEKLAKKFLKHHVYV